MCCVIALNHVKKRNYFRKVKFKLSKHKKVAQSFLFIVDWAINEHFS